MIWFTADLHLDHKNIIEFCQRPFISVDDMNSVIIDNLNHYCDVRDTLYILGDFCFSSALNFIDKIKCQNKRLILGNHDQRSKKRIEGFDYIKDVEYLRHDGNRFFLSHYAHRTWRNSIHGAYHLYGHSHGKLSGVGRSMDVGVDALDFEPISIDDVVGRLEDRDWIDQHQVDT
jgi:calcineurin-like phosphoesterase family protein